MDDKPIFGIWLPSVGWLKAKDDFIVYSNTAQAQQVAHNVGKGARLYYADSSVVVMDELQRLYLEQEQRTLCHYFNSLLRCKTNS